MLPTVDLEIDSKTGNHSIQLRCENGSLTPEQAMKLSADLATVVSFVLNSIKEPETVETPNNVIKMPVPASPVEINKTPTWHKVAPQSSQYMAELDEDHQALVAKSGKAWDVFIVSPEHPKGRKINTTPIPRKTDAYDFVQQVREQTV